MPLSDEIAIARTEIISDGYEMSIGEIINLYRDDELKINPAYQRLFRWDETNKTRFIESLLLGIPIPPIFVFQDENGVWELIDGLQRLSTVFQFVGILKGTGENVAPLMLSGTNYLPSLDGKKWEPSSEDADDGIGQAQQLQVKRARLRVEILKKESDTKAKYELFQRLNTGGERLSEQEVRNCIAVMINPDFHTWITGLSTFAPFTNTTAQTETAIDSQGHVELVLRFFSFLNTPYNKALDVHEYLDSSLVAMAADETFDRDAQGDIFKRVFTVLDNALGSDAFKRWDGTAFKGKFLISVFEVLAPGIARNLPSIEEMDADTQKNFVTTKAKELWTNDTFRNNSGGGTRGTTRLVNLLPMGQEFLRP